MALADARQRLRTPPPTVVVRVQVASRDTPRRAEFRIAIALRLWAGPRLMFVCRATQWSDSSCVAAASLLIPHVPRTVALVGTGQAASGVEGETVEDSSGAWKVGCIAIFVSGECRGFGQGRCVWPRLLCSLSWIGGLVADHQALVAKTPRDSIFVSVDG